LLPPKGKIVQKKFEKIEKKAESFVGISIAMVGFFIIGLSA